MECIQYMIKNAPLPSSFRPLFTWTLIDWVFLNLLTEKNINLINVQANVYHATKADGKELAIKVYKTSVLVFK